MYDKRTFIGIAVACGLFILLGVVLDRDLLLYSCRRDGKGLQQEKERVIAAVRVYNAILSDIYASGGVPKLLNEFPATKTIRHGLFRDIGFIRDSGRVLVYDLATITPVDIRIDRHNAADAVVFEEWNYVYQRKDNREQISRIRGLGQGFKYRLVKERGTWVVSAWDPVDVAEPLKKGK